MNIYRRFVNWMNGPNDTLQAKWDEKPVSIAKVTLQFDNGRIRILEGDAAKEWVKDIWFVRCGRRDSNIDWTRHKWIDMN